MTTKYFRSNPRTLSGYEKDLCSAWGLSRKTVKLVSNLREMTGTEWQLRDEKTAAVASALHEMGFDEFAKFTAKKAGEVMEASAASFRECGYDQHDPEREILLEESVGTLRKNERWEGDRVVRF